MPATLTLLGLGMVLLGIFVAMFSKGQGLRLGLVGVALLFVGQLDLSNDLVLLIAVGIVVVMFGLGAVRLFFPRSATGVAVILFAVLLGIAWTLNLSFIPSSEPAPKSDPVSRCDDVVFLGLRGSGEGRDAGNGYGGVVAPIRDGLVRALGSDSTFSDIPIDYPALAVMTDDWSIVKDTILGDLKDGEYIRGAEQGAKILASTVRQIRDHCGDRSDVVVVGYSQGAMAAHAGVASLPAEDAAIIDSLQLVSDPWRKKGTPDAETGERRRQAGVAWSGIEPVPGPLPQGLATSWCAAYDLVCSANALHLWRLQVHVTHYSTEELTAKTVASIREDLAH